jgi:hypothetical protein
MFIHMDVLADDRDAMRRGRVASIAVGLLLLLAATECATHQSRDGASYRAGYTAATGVPGFGPGAFTDSRVGVAMCEELLDREINSTGFATLRQNDFRAGCTQAFRDASE